MSRNRRSTIEGINSRQNIFDFIRLAAAVAVVVEHSVRHFDVSFLWHGPDDRYWFNGGVATFFIISGMMVYQSGYRCYADGRPWLDYVWNRTLRIVPAIYVYFLVLVFLLLITRVLSPASLLTPEFAVFSLSNLLLAPVYSPSILDDFGIGVINGSLWTIPVEVSFYLVVPLIVILATRKGAKVVLPLLMVFAGIGTVAYGLLGAAASESLAVKLFAISFVPHLWWFAVGIAFGAIWNRIPHRFTLAATALLLYFVLAKLPFDAGPSFIANALAAIPLGYAVLWAGNYGPTVLKRLTDWLGDLSFSTYIWHMIVVNFLITWGAKNWEIPGTLLVCVAIAISCAIAIVSWHLVVRPKNNSFAFEF